MIRATMLVAGLSMSSALLVGTPKMHSVARSSSISATIASKLATMDGPDLYWEEVGPLQNPPKEESDFKEYDTYSTFLDACSAHGVDLCAPDITVFAPGNLAVKNFEAVYGPLTKDVCAYHIVKGKVPTSSLGSAALDTVQGSTITYRRMFRKDFVDN